MVLSTYPLTRRNIENLGLQRGGSFDAAVGCISTTRSRTVAGQGNSTIEHDLVRLNAEYPRHGEHGRWLNAMQCPIVVMLIEASRVLAMAEQQQSQAQMEIHAQHTTDYKLYYAKSSNHEDLDEMSVPPHSHKSLETSLAAGRKAVTFTLGGRERKETHGE